MNDLIFQIGDIFESKDNDYNHTFAIITAVGKNNLCFDYSKDFIDLNKGICMEGCASFNDFLSHYHKYIEKPKNVTLYRYLIVTLQNDYILTQWSNIKYVLNDKYLKEFTLELNLGE